MPSDYVTSLDAALAQSGEDVTITRGVTAVTGRGCVRAFRPEEIVGGIQQSDSSVILSPTSLAGWAASPPVPRTNDKITIQGRSRNVTFVKPIAVNNEVVRYELTVAG